MTTTTELHPAALAAGAWWAEQLGAPVFRAVRGDEPRSEREPMEFASLLQTLIASKHRMTEEQGGRFAVALAGTVTEWPAKGQRRIALGVDYGPDRELADAARAAGIDLARFPWKTMMWVREDHVTAALGYGAEARLVWGAEDWVRPACHRLGYDRATETYREERCGLPRYHDGDHGGWEPLTETCSGCDLTEAGHNNRDRVPGDFHPFEVQA